MRQESAMRHLHAVCAILLSIPLIGSAVNHVFRWVKPPMSDGSRGAQMWDLIRDGGLMAWLAVGHLLLGILLLVPRTRFAAGVMQLPITIGIAAFNVTMFPPGIALAVGMLVVNLGVVLDRRGLSRLLAPAAE
ncbi:MAG: hypothetical protein ACKOHI_00035 [Phycisphaerales bacterium]